MLFPSLVYAFLRITDSTISLKPPDMVFPLILLIWGVGLVQHRDADSWCQNMRRHGWVQSINEMSWKPTLVLSAMCNMIKEPLVNQGQGGTKDIICRVASSLQAEIFCMHCLHFGRQPQCVILRASMQICCFAELTVKLEVEAIKNQVSKLEGDKHGAHTFPEVRVAVIELHMIGLVNISHGPVSPSSSVHVVEDVDKMIPLLKSRLEELKAASDSAFDPCQQHVMQPSTNASCVSTQ